MQQIELVEPFPVWAWPLAWEWYARSRRIAADDFGPASVNEFVEYSIGAFESGKVFGVCYSGQIGGVIQFEQATPVMAIGHVLFAPWLLRHRGASAEALKLACARLFETSKTVKILGLIPENNRLAIALCARNGATVEGLLRHHTVRDGKPINAVAVGITREEFERGTIIRRSKEQEHIRYESGIDVHTGTERAPERDPGFAQEPVAGPDVGRDLPERGGHSNQERGHDQQGVDGDGRPDAKVPGKPRLRPERGKRKGATANGTGKAGVARPKQRKRRADAAQPE